ncbi:MAG: DUF6089 family protein [Bacteroidota bacterium]
MRQFLLLGVFSVLLTALLVPQTASAQNYRFEAGFNVGGTNYLGDIGGKYLEGRNSIADIRLKQTSLAGGIYAKYALSPRLGIALSGLYGRIRGDDSLTTNPQRNARNLSFRNDIKQIALTLEYEIYEAYNIGRNTKYRIDYSLYLLGGASYFMHNPQAEYGGKWYDLQPLKTEGVNYSLTGISVLGGFGMDFTLDRNYKIGFKLMGNFTNTDHLDDISGKGLPRAGYTYDAAGNLAYALSDRRGEADPTYVRDPSIASLRGGGNNDAFISATLNFAYVFKGKGGKYNRAFHNGYIRKKGKRLGVSRFFAF